MSDSMTDRELLQRVLDEYDENMLRTPSFVTMEMIREHLLEDAECPECSWERSLDSHGNPFHPVRPASGPLCSVHAAERHPVE